MHLGFDAFDLFLPDIGNGVGNGGFAPTSLSEESLTLRSIEAHIFSPPFTPFWNNSFPIPGFEWWELRSIADTISHTKHTALGLYANVCIQKTWVISIWLIVRSFMFDFQ